MIVNYEAAMLSRANRYIMHILNLVHIDTFFIKVDEKQICVDEKQGLLQVYVPRSIIV